MKCNFSVASATSFFRETLTAKANLKCIRERFEEKANYGMLEIHRKPLFNC